MASPTWRLLARRCRGRCPAGACTSSRQRVCWCNPRAQVSGPSRFRRLRISWVRAFMGRRLPWEVCPLCSQAMGLPCASAATIPILVTMAALDPATQDLPSSAILGALVGGDGHHGDFSTALAQDLGNGVFEIQTNNTTIPASQTSSGLAEQVTDGHFSFASFVVPAGVTVRFRGSVPAVVRVRGEVRIDGTLDASADPLPAFFGGLEPCRRPWTGRWSRRTRRCHWGAWWPSMSGVWSGIWPVSRSGRWRSASRRRARTGPCSLGYRVVMAPSCSAHGNRAHAAGCGKQFARRGPQRRWWRWSFSAARWGGIPRGSLPG